MAIIRMHFRVPDGVKCSKVNLEAKPMPNYNHCPFRTSLYRENNRFQAKCNMFNKQLVLDTDDLPFKCQDCIEHEIPELQPPEPASNN